MRAKRDPREPMRHHRLELSEADNRRLEAVAAKLYLSMATYIRQAVLKEITRDERKITQ